MASTLKNESRQAQVIILDHPAFANRESGWQRSAAKFASQDDNGVHNVSEVRRAYPGTLTLQPGEEIVDLHDAIANCSQVPQLIAARILSVRVQPRKKAEKAEANS